MSSIPSSAKRLGYTFANNVPQTHPTFSPATNNFNNISNMTMPCPPVAAPISKCVEIGYRATPHNPLTRHGPQHFPSLKQTSTPIHQNAETAIANTSIKKIGRNSIVSWQPSSMQRLHHHNLSPSSQGNHSGTFPHQSSGGCSLIWTCSSVGQMQKKKPPKKASTKL